MKILAVEMENYGPFYGVHRLELADRGLVCILGDNQDEPRMNSNGAGKSSAFDALDWGLFGVVPRGDGVDSVINDRAAQEGQGTRVAVHCQEGDGLLVVERTRAYGAPGEQRSGVRLVYNGEDHSNLDAKETQRWIEWHLGLDRQVFHAAVLFAQTELFCFADATDAQRLDILTKILRLELIDEWLARAKLEQHSIESQAREADKALASFEATLGVLQSSGPDEDLHARYEAERHANAQRLAQQYEDGQAELLALRAQSPDAAQLQAWQLAARPAPLALSAQHAQCQADLAQAKQNAMPIVRRDVELQAELRQAQAASEKEHCPTCQQPMPADVVAAARRQAEALALQVAASQDTVGQWQSYIAQIEAVLAHCEADREQAVHYQSEQAAEARQRLAAQQDVLRRLQRQEAQLQALDKEMARVAQAENPAAAQERARADKRQQAMRAIAGCRTKLDALAERRQAVAFWVDAFGSKGLKSYILDARLDEMTQSANHWVQLLTGGTYWIRLETQTATKKGALRNRFNIRVFNGHGQNVRERNYRSWSGGQKQRVSLAIDFGLSRLVAKRASKEYDLLLLDEVFRHLDSSGRDAVMEMLHALNREKSSIFVVDHDAEFLSQFDRQVTVRMQDGQASFVQPEAALADSDPEPVPPPEAPPAKKAPPRRRKKTPVRAEAE